LIVWLRSREYNAYRRKSIEMSVTVYWFRKALRLHDNPSLLTACEHALKNGSSLLPIFILDPWFIKSGNVCDNRLLFLLEVW
jgi:cryptochrome